MRDRTVASLLAIALVLLSVSPALGRDRDKDGLRDGFEAKYGVTSPDKRDTDGDGVIDAAEDDDHDRLGNLGEQRFGTHPGRRDTDRDGGPDGAEDKDGDGLSNAREQDRRKLPATLKPTLDRAKQDAPLDRPECLTKEYETTPKRCWFGPVDASTTVAIMGDSHALMLLPPLISTATEQGLRLVTLFKGGCVPVLFTMNSGQYALDRGESCRAWRQDAYRWLRENPVDLLLLTSADTYGLVDSNGRALNPGKKAGAWKTGMLKTLDSLPEPSRVMLLGDVPHNSGNPISCVKSHTSNMSACLTRREPRSKRTIEIALREAAAAKGAQFRTLVGKICTYDPCPVVQGNILIWRDRHHLTATFANKIAPSVSALVMAGLRTPASGHDRE